MNRRMMYLLLSSILITGWLIWPGDQSLPVLKTTQPFEMKSVLQEGHYSSHNGKIKIVAFFYTACPDICPFTMSDLSDVQTAVKENPRLKEKVELVSITLDPEEDTAERITQYAEAFQADPWIWHWLKGTAEETDAVTKDYQMQSVKLDDQTIAHSTTLYMVDQQHQIRGMYPMATQSASVNKKQLLEDIQSLLDGS
ncbi:SCO family protein [Jeotgalibacillus sp. R-1-5s-1]|uniref:SCO family protein n=1 Tax=Jeotgalibacillus sp. R-1-5s-1 TaxID=2555897 RepID=UPI00106D8F41|nr:SCO family protein [Jeotgalibacillus sp. R-1-5s-1]TFE00139.1 SCO family protein [Jeotgalibacillus sp. R-1-5s-1]